jgi:hypothetical protein
MDALLLSIAICCVFAVFAAVLAWTDRQTTRWQRERLAETNRTAADTSRKRAA